MAPRLSSVQSVIKAGSQKSKASQTYYLASKALHLVSQLQNHNVLQCYFYQLLLFKESQVQHGVLSFFRFFKGLAYIGSDQGRFLDLETFGAQPTVAAPEIFFLGVLWGCFSQRVLKHIGFPIKVPGYSGIFYCSLTSCTGVRGAYSPGKIFF